MQHTLRRAGLRGKDFSPFIRLALYWRHLEHFRGAGVTPPPDIPEKEIRKRCAWLLSAAAEEARRLGHNYVGTEHIFIAATKLEDGATGALLRRAGLNPRQVRNEIRREIGT